MQEIINKIIEKKKIIKVDKNTIEILTDAEIERNINVRIFIKKINDKIYLSDDKNTLRFMNVKYLLKAPDVKRCINDIVKHYNFTIEKGEIMSELKPSDNFIKKYNDLLVCSCTLAKMYIFFDTPGEA